MPVALDKHVLDFDIGDAVLREAAQIQQLLHIEELRELQTKSKEDLVAVNQPLLLIQRQTPDWGKLEDEHFMISASHLLSTAGTRYSLACV